MDYLRRAFSPGPRSPEDQLTALMKQKDELKDKQFMALRRGDEDSAKAIGQKIDAEVKPAIQAILSSPHYIAQDAVDGATMAAAGAHAAMGLMHHSRAQLIDRAQGALSDVDYAADQPFQDAKQAAEGAVREFDGAAKQATKAVGDVAQHLEKATVDDHIGALADLKMNVRAAKKVAFAAPATADSAQENASAVANDQEMDDLQRRLDALKRSGGAKKKTRRRASRKSGRASRRRRTRKGKRKPKKKTKGRRRRGKGITERA